MKASTNKHIANDVLLALSSPCPPTSFEIIQVSNKGQGNYQPLFNEGEAGFWS